MEAASRHRCLCLKVSLLSHQAPTIITLHKLTIYQELDLCPMISLSAEIHSGTGMAVVCNHVEMVLIILILGADVIRTAEIRTGMLIIEISTIETIIGLRDLFHSL